ncbi:MAG: TonB family protein [Nitrospira sp.]|nr:TonB family protein [Nitrospira sp.]
MPFQQGWLGSIALHGLVFLSLFPLFRQSLFTIPNEPFHWDVALVQSTPTAHKSGQNTDVPHPTITKQPDRTPPTSHANHTIHHAAPSAGRIASLAQKAEAPVTSTSMADNPSPVPSPSETATSSIPNELPPMTQAHEPPRQQTDTQIGSTTQAPPQLETTASAPIEESARRTDAVQPSPLSATVLDATAVSEIRPDYSWLQQAIFRRLEELKRSSRPSLDDSRPLKVMVRVVISREGTLLDSTVVTSSGLDRIDQEAMALVQRAFPMQLDRPLDRQQVAMRIPITYSRE